MKTKRILSLFIIISMMMSLLGFSVHSEEIEENPQISIIHNIAEKYTGEAILPDENIHWFLADLAEYNTLYPENSFAMSQTQKQACLDKVIEFADNATAPGDLAKSIIALRSLGYDAKNVTTKENQKIDIVEKLTDLVDAQDAAVTDEYTLPYVIIALQQGEGYATQEQINYLIGEAVSTKLVWQSLPWGYPDSATPMVRALYPYYEKPEIEIILNETIPIITGCQTDSGLISDSVCSTGIAMVALATMGEDCEMVIKNEKNLIEGIMAYATDAGFSQWNESFDTEQAFRGLIAWQLSKQGKRIYDFSLYPMNEAKATVDLPQPTPEPTPEPTPDDSTDMVSIKIKVMIHDDDECDNSYTYKNNSGNYTALLNQTIIAESGASVFDALVEALTLNGIDYVEGSDGYIVSIDGVSEFDHGNKSGWMFTVDGEYINTGSSSTLLTEDATVVWFYTDDYSKERGSENYSTSLGGEPVKPKTDLDKKEEIKENTGLPNKNPDVLTPSVKYDEKTFDDITNHKNQIIIEELAKRGIINGMTDTRFSPNSTMTRAEFSTIVVQALGLSTQDNAVFNDVLKDSWYYDFVNIAYHYGIVNGVSKTEFCPQGTITREQAACMVQRAAVLCGMQTEFDDTATRNILAEFVDYVTISDWAKTAMAFCYNEGILDKSVIEIKPQEEITRAEVAQMVYNMLKEVELI